MLRVLSNRMVEQMTMNPELIAKMPREELDRTLDRLREARRQLHLDVCALEDECHRRSGLRVVEYDCDNLFKLYGNHPSWRETEAKLKAACAEAATKIAAIQDQHSDCGASDTDSRDAITSHLWDLLLCPPKRRLQMIEAWRQHVVEGKSIRKIVKVLRYEKLVHARSDIWLACNLLREMADDELLATLKLGQERLSWVREQIEVVASQQLRSK
jgi:hypothetical protein